VTLSERPYLGFLRSLSQWCSLTVVVIGVLALVSWRLGLGEPVSVLPFLAGVRLGSATGLILAGSALWLWHRFRHVPAAHVAGYALSVAVLLLAVLTLAQWLSGSDLGMDRWTILRGPGQDELTGRMNTNTAVALASAAGGLIILYTGRRRWHLSAVLVIGSISIVVLIGYLFSVRVWTGAAPQVAGTSLPTAIGLLMLAVGLFFARPEADFVAIFSGSGSGGEAARRLFLPALLAPLIVAMVVAVGIRAGLYGGELAGPIFMVLIIGVLASFTLHTAHSLERIDSERERAERSLQGALAELQESSVELERRVEQRTAQLWLSHRALEAEISERRQAEEEVRRLNLELEARVADRTSQLEATVRELDSFSYSVSHDLRAPLRAISGFSQILLDEYYEQLPPDGQRYLHLVDDNAQQMTRLIDDLLQFSRLGRQALSLQPVDVDALVKKVIAGLEPEWDGRQVEIKLGELPMAEADPTLLQQVYLNLLTNALKFTRMRAPAVIEIGHRSEGPGSAAAYFVRDNGVGFDMAYADKLFGVFQRLHRAEDYEGTGVGLAIVQRAIHKHGGDVWAESEVDKGSTFYFTLQ
jgi:signal transduction histidine kinase